MTDPFMLTLPSSRQSQDTHDNVLTQLGKIIPSVIPLMDEGIQIWDKSGKLIYANRATTKHFGGIQLEDIVNYTALLARCRHMDGKAFSLLHFPIARVLENKQFYRADNVQINGNKRLWLQLNAYPIFTDDYELSGVLSTSHDITTLVEKGLRLELDAHYDALTGLPNRTLLNDRMQVAMSQAQRNQKTMAVCMMDLDGFKAVNDNLGHEAGDILLKQVAARLKSNLRDGDTAIRLGGDEFILLIGDMKSEVDCDLTLHRIMNAIAKPFKIQARAAHVTASIGITLFPGDNSVPDQLLRHADQAMYKAKENGKNCYQLYDPTLESRLKANKGIIKRIERALTTDQLCLYYQPKVDCIEGRVIGMEALLRWDHPILGIRSPSEFLPLIEHHDLIIDFGNWVLKNVLQQMEEWHLAGINIPVSLNVSARQFLKGNFEQRLDYLIKKYPPELINLLEIEILETAALEDMNKVSSIINEYKNKGISFSLDDFGTGYSSLVHLKHLSVDTLKIDQSFINDMASDPGNLAIIQGVIGLANAFQLEVIAEGVENIEQSLMLLDLGCHIIQGFHVARPMPADKIPHWIQDFSKDPRWQVANNKFPRRNDFNLLLLEVSHRFWLNTLQSQQTYTTSQAATIYDYQNCGLTKWYDEKGLQQFGSLPEFHQLDEIHRQVHAIGECISHNDYSDESLDSLNQKLIQANQKLVDKLREFRTKVVNQKPVYHS